MGLLDIFELDSCTFATVLELCEGGDLDSHLQGHHVSPQSHFHTPSDGHVRSTLLIVSYFVSLCKAGAAVANALPAVDAVVVLVGAAVVLMDHTHV